MALRRNPTLIIAILSVVGFIYFWKSPRISNSWRRPAAVGTAAPSHEPPCSALPGATDVFVLLKTGAREARSMIPPHLETTLRCAPEFAVYSDVADTIQGVQIHDILSTLPQSTQHAYPEFDTYRTLRERQAAGFTDFSDLLTVPPGAKKEDAPGWKLDKWKFFPMLREANAHPTAKWFLFIETDTSIVWSNLVRWLQRLDHSRPYYLGGQSFFGDHLFAHGGSGFILSRPAVEKAMKSLDTEVSRWLRVAEEECCGDSMLAHLIHDGTDLRMMQSWPMIQGETVSTLDYTERHWCFPVVSQHHMNSEDTRAMWAFEQEWLRNETTAPMPVLHKDVFEHFVAPIVLSETGARHVDWDNLSKDQSISASTAETDEPNPAVRSGYRDADACRSACANKQECIQWSHSSGICNLGFVIRMGAKVEPGAAETTSGWMGDRIEAFRRRMEPCYPRWILKDGDGP